ncbi:MAG TPA: FkbM family methyltransferase [Acidimicrobiales bacterium]|jgi:FkbM family methyltransferase|nr:FkbM family methyltransferase [Acidimicrobiales bacterium]
MRLLEDRRVGLVLDVGANVGQYGRELRTTGYTGRIVSFEPLQEAYAALRSVAAGDPAWEVENVALGEADGEVVLNVASNSQSSSVLDMRSEHRLAAPDVRYVGRERARMTTLAAALGRHARPDDQVFVKVDVQGYEQPVVQGGADALQRVVGFQLELSLVPLYDGQPVLDEMTRRMRELGFTLMSLEPVFWNPATGQLLQVDGLFFRSS